MAKNEPMAKATSASGAADGSVLSETLCPYRSEFPNGSKGNDKNQATEKMQRKKTKPLKSRGFSDFLARCTEKDITGFFEKSACGKAFSDFFVNPHCPICRGWDTFSFLVRTEKDISKFKRHLIILVSCD